MKVRLSMIAGLVAGIAVAALVFGGIIAFAPDPPAPSPAAPSFAIGTVAPSAGASSPATASPSASASGSPGASGSAGPFDVLPGVNVTP
ncbi:MAG: hypothetical protein QOE66_105 [Chloroflexota bacterium]|jgi:hypothetical protein|nr:hypothetical protein [Chloroflexota bacterium]